MKRTSTSKPGQNERMALAWLAGFCLSLAAAGAAQPQVPVAVLPTPDTPTHLAGFVLVKSEFIDDPRFGKDPFYPRSTRRNGIRVNPTSEPAPIVTDVSLKGISGTPARPLAIINNRTFEVGESADLRVKGQVVRVQCLEINDKFVKITINGVPKELPRF